MVWIGAGLLALFFVLRTFVADIYRVESGSMEPTIYGGEPWDEWVLVCYGGFEQLKRFDLAVAYKGDGNPVVSLEPSGSVRSRGSRARRTPLVR